MDALTDIVKQAKHAIANAQDLPALEQLRVFYLGKKGEITSLLKTLGTISADERPRVGQLINDAKDLIESDIQNRHTLLETQQLNQELARETIDVTLPGIDYKLGSLHPLTRSLQRLCEIFKSLGFQIIEGPEVETEYYNFTALNTPEHHPARAMHDTFYFADGRLLRSHTSPVQIHHMQNHEPPFRLIAPGRVYRRDSDMTHTPMFNQIEGLLLSENSSFADLKGLLHTVLEQFFEKELKIRMRPSYFPFTEPSAEVDVAFGDKWLEILGCGMVHPNVLQSCNIDSERYTGFAFGMGLERLVMLRYGIPDLRLLFENDLRFLKQFA
ncbi:MAG: phenylalanine--tRNA ligase subunit alpha [Legionellales bacterium]|jgi:phenylalanyl-tRNA synthetase alpha chain